MKNWLEHVRPAASARFYQLKALAKNGRRTSGIHELDPFLKDYESEYHYLFKCVLDARGIAAGGSIQRYYELPNLCRRLLEAFLIFKVPDENSLFQRLEAIDFDGPRKTRLLRFVDTHSHAEQIAEGHDDASAVAEAPEVVRDLLELIERCDPQHYERMNRKLGNMRGV